MRIGQIFQRADAQITLLCLFQQIVIVNILEQVNIFRCREIIFQIFRRCDIERDIGERRLTPARRNIQVINKLANRFLTSVKGN